MKQEFVQSWTEAQLLDKLRETLEEPEPAEVFLEVTQPPRRRSLRLSFAAEAAMEPEIRQNQLEYIKDRQQLIERKIDSNTQKLDSIEENILGDLLPSILREVMELRRDLRS